MAKLCCKKFNYKYLNQGSFLAVIFVIANCTVCLFGKSNQFFYFLAPAIPYTAEVSELGSDYVHVQTIGPIKGIHDEL